MLSRRERVPVTVFFVVVALVAAGLVARAPGVLMPTRAAAAVTALAALAAAGTVTVHAVEPDQIQRGTNDVDGTVRRATRGPQRLAGRFETIAFPTRTSSSDVRVRRLGHRTYTRNYSSSLWSHLRTDGDDDVTAALADTDPVAVLQYVDQHYVWVDEEKGAWGQEYQFSCGSCGVPDTYQHEVDDDTDADLSGDGPADPVMLITFTLDLRRRPVSIDVYAGTQTGEVDIHMTLSDFGAPLSVAAPAGARSEEPPDGP